MRKFLALFCTGVICGLMIAAFDDLAPTVNAGQDANDKKGRATRKQDDDRELAAAIRRLTDRTSDGLTETDLPNGGVALDLDGRFQNVMLARLDKNAEPIAACVTSLDEANHFFGKDLETGEPVAQSDFVREDLATVAARHGMSEQEFAFYSQMASLAVQQQVMMSPNAAVISINNLDAAGEGFNDPTVTVPEGGNNGLTRGAQRLNLFNFAAGIWGNYLDSASSITIDSRFDPLFPCTPSGGVLGSAGAIQITRNFTNAEFPNTWYPEALANKRAGGNLIPGFNEIQATFNSDVDTGCLGVGVRFYYGFDNTTPSQRINLLVVLLHEMGHGLGFQSFVNGSTGVFPGGTPSPDIYSRYMFDRSTGLYWHQMTNAQRVTSATNVNNVLWDGPNVRIASGNLTFGRDAATGRVELFTPNPLQGGSSISHFSTAATPNLLMEPSINIGLPIDLDLTRQQMRDIGWYADATLNTVADTIINVTPNSGAVVIGNNVNITWANTGGFSRNVTIELSTNGGTTFPTTVAANVANTGSFSWTVPALPTTQARIRVREVNFAAPSGVSSANFTISSVPSASLVSVSGRVVDSAGRGLGRAQISLGAKTVQSNAFGYFRFEGVLTGASYAVSVKLKRYEFTPQLVNVEDDVTGLVFAPIDSAGGVNISSAQRSIMRR